MDEEGDELGFITSAGKQEATEPLPDSSGDDESDSGNLKRKEKIKVTPKKSNKQAVKSDPSEDVPPSSPLPTCTEEQMLAYYCLSPTEIENFIATYQEFVLTSSDQIEQVHRLYRKMRISGKDGSPCFPRGWYEEESHIPTAVQWLPTSAFIVDIRSIPKEEMNVYLLFSNPTYVFVDSSSPD